MSGLPRGPYTVKIRATVTRIGADGAEGAEGAEAYARAMSSAALLLAAYCDVGRSVGSSSRLAVGSPDAASTAHSP